MFAILLRCYLYLKDRSHVTNGACHTRSDKSLSSVSVFGACLGRVRGDAITQSRAHDGTISTNIRSLRPLPTPTLAVQVVLFPMFFWHPHPTFDFWHHHSQHKHHDQPPSSGADSDGSPSYEVFLEPAENPQELSLVRRWLAVICISTASICVTCASSMVRTFSIATFSPR